MNKDVRLGTDYSNHPKIRKLYKELGAEGVMCHTFLLCNTAQYFPSGEFKDMSVEDIATLADWKDDPELFLNALLKVKLIDNNGDTYSIHNWLKHNLFAATAPKRSAIARANIKKRWDKKTKLIQKDSTDGKSDGITDGNSDAIPEGYTPTPSPSPKEREGEVGGEDSLEQSPPPPPPPIEQRLIKSAKEIYKTNGEIDLSMERGWLLQYESLLPEKKIKVKRLAEFMNVRLPLD